MAERDAASGSDPDRPQIEPRWPAVLAVSAFILLTVGLRVLVPRRQSVGPHWVAPAIEIALLVSVLAAHPAAGTTQARRLRGLSITLTVMLAASAVVSTALLVYELIIGSELTSAADTLLAAGTLVWAGNALTFGLLYWQLDSGGPLARHRSERQHPDFAFTQQLSPELAPPGWRPRYVDYLVLGFTTSTAFSPTDVMPMAPWAKLTMATQSLISLTVIGLVIARAVNVFS